MNAVYLLADVMQHRRNEDMTKKQFDSFRLLLQDS